MKVRGGSVLERDLGRAPVEQPDGEQRGREVAYAHRRLGKGQQRRRHVPRVRAAHEEHLKGIFGGKTRVREVLDKDEAAAA